MSLWWLEPGWKQQCCANCGRKIWPEGDPDWGLCFDCFTAQLNEQEAAEKAYNEQAEREYMAELEREHERS